MSGAQYRLGPLLGAGGMAEVFFGQAQGVDGFLLPVAIKKVRSAHLADPEFLAAFSAEAKLAARLSHPNIVRVIDYQHDAGGAPFIVMEYIYGRDLSALRRKGALPCSVAVYVIGEMLRGLAYAHDLPTTAGLRGVVHRDISPQNVLLSWHGEVKISDFGIARAFSTSHLAQSATIRGKPGYMSPEQINAEPLDGRSDLFSVGVVFWELLTGSSLFDATTYRETMARVLYRQIPRPSQEAPVPADVEAVVMRLLERDLSARYATAHDAISDLLACEAAPRNGIQELAKFMAQRCEKPRSITPKMGLAITPPSSGASLASSPQAIAMTAPALPSAEPSTGERRTRTVDVPLSGPHDRTLGPGTLEPWHALTKLAPAAPVMLTDAAPPRAPKRAVRWAVLGALLMAGAGAVGGLTWTRARSSAPAPGAPLSPPATQALPTRPAPLATSSPAPASPATSPPAGPAAGAAAPATPATEGPTDAPPVRRAPDRSSPRGTPSNRTRTPPESARPDRIVDIKLRGG